MFSIMTTATPAVYMTLYPEQEERLQLKRAYTSKMTQERQQRKGKKMDAKGKQQECS